MGCRRAISNNIAPKPRFFSSEAGKFPRAARRARGPKARGHGLLPEGIYWPRTKIARGRGGYIVVYSTTRPHIYNIYTTSECLTDTEDQVGIKPSLQKRKLCDLGGDQMGLIPSIQKRKLNCYEHNQRPNVFSQKKKNFKTASDLGLFL